MAQTTSSGSELCLYFLALFISPIPVLMKRGCGADFLINIALFILGWIPGVIHAWWIISKNTPHVAHSPHHSTHAAPRHSQPAYVAPQQQHATGAHYGTMQQPQARYAPPAGSKY